MYSFSVHCSESEIELLSLQMWEAGTVAIREDVLDEDCVLTAGFTTDKFRDQLLVQFASHQPAWRKEPEVDWVQWTKEQWPAQLIGSQLFLAPLWSDEETPAGRIRLNHNPGLACGTGDHPCTCMALCALEQHAPRASTLVDLGTGSGLLAIAAKLLGAKSTIALDVDQDIAPAVRENFHLNGLNASLAIGSADTLAARCADVLVANISAVVLLNIMEDLLRITRSGGTIILTGFEANESEQLRQLFTVTSTMRIDEWCCLIGVNH